jgi:signal transduction histidine kinase
MITALDSREARLAGLVAGADDFLTKPFDSMEIQVRMKNILRLNRYRSLLTERERFLWMVENSENGYLILSNLNDIHYANRCAQQLLQLPEDSLHVNFLSHVASYFRLEPAENWQRWGEESLPCYLVQPETPTGRACWLEVNYVDTPLGRDNHRIVRLQDVTDKMLVDQDMRKFHSLVAHKLRTPVYQLFGGMTLLAENIKTLEKDEIDTLVETSWQGSKRLMEDVHSVLEYIDTPLYQSDPTPLALATIADMAGCIAREHEIGQYSVNLPAELALTKVGMTVAAMEMVLHEVMENAVKFHPQKTPIVAVKIFTVDEGKVCISISDDGLTLTPEQIRKVWLPYFQGERYFTGSVPGMGLGLPTVASLVWRAGGQVRLSNKETAPGVQLDILLPVIGADCE